MYKTLDPTTVTGGVSRIRETLQGLYGNEKTKVIIQGILDGTFQCRVFSDPNDPTNATGLLTYRSKLTALKNRTENLKSFEIGIVLSRNPFNWKFVLRPAFEKAEEMHADAIHTIVGESLKGFFQSIRFRVAAQRQGAYLMAIRRRKRPRDMKDEDLPFKKRKEIRARHA